MSPLGLYSLYYRNIGINLRSLFLVYVAYVVIMGVIFLVNENKIGHIGLTDYDMGNDSVKIMSVVKGENVFFPRLMEYVGKNLINWIFYELNISTVKVRVFSDNYKAINMNERIGMLTVDSIPMKKEKTLDGFSWKECRFNCKDDSRIVRYMNIMEIHR